MTNAIQKKILPLAELFLNRFFVRTDKLAVLPNYSFSDGRRAYPLPVETKSNCETSHLLQFIKAHLSPDAPPVGFSYQIKTGKHKNDIRPTKEHFRIGTYTPSIEGLTNWLCLDFDGAGHADALKSPLDAVKKTIDCLNSKFNQSNILPYYIEHSGGGHGYHLWMFFNPAIQAAEARKLGFSIIPDNILLSNGKPASPVLSMGIEVFPKQDKPSTRNRNKWHGSMVWLPMYYRAPELSGVETANKFLNPNRDFSPEIPDDFLTITPEKIQEISHLFIEIPKPEYARSNEKRSNSKTDNKINNQSTSSKTPPPWSGDPVVALSQWRKNALAALDLSTIYNEYLTGNVRSAGWLECRDPRSESGDVNPSAGVSTGNNDAEKGVFHSFRDNITMSIFDFIILIGGGDMNAAVKKIALLSGVKLPYQTQKITPATPEEIEFLDNFSDKSQIKPRLNPENPDLSADKPNKKTPVIRPKDQLDSQIAPLNGKSTPLNDEKRVLIATKPSLKKNNNSDNNDNNNDNNNSNKNNNSKQNSSINSKVQSITVNNRQMADVISDAWNAVKKHKKISLYIRGGEPVYLTSEIRLGYSEPIEQIVIRGFSVNSFREYLSKIANWVNANATGYLSVFPPRDISAAMMDCPTQNLPPLLSIARAPFYDGKANLIAQTGYHKDAATYYQPSKNLEKLQPISEKPTPDELEKAKKIIFNDLLSDFPFADESSRTHALAALLQSFMRRIIKGPTPLYLIEAPTQGSGKTLLAEAISCVVAGVELPGRPFSKEDEEVRKVITTELRSGRPLFLFDNLPERREINSQALSIALTSPVWQDRMLGGNNELNLPIGVTWLATGNNPRFGRDLMRRIVNIRLTPAEEKPWERTAFKHDPLLEWIKNNRPSLIWACLTIIQNWLSKNKEKYSGKHRFGSFESWLSIMGGIMQAADIQGLLDNQSNFFEDATPDFSSWKPFIEMWWDLYKTKPTSVKILTEICETHDFLSSTLGDKSPRSQVTRFGHALKSRRDRVFNGKKIEFYRDRKLSLYRLIDVENPLNNTGKSGQQNLLNDPENNTKITPENPNFYTEQNNTITTPENSDFFDSDNLSDIEFFEGNENENE